MDASFPDLAAGIPELPTTIVRTRGGYELLSRVRVPRPIEEVFTFFSNPRNLQELTPDHVGFRILNEGEVELWVAERVSGPWENAGVVYEIPAPWDDATKHLVYAVKAHPELAPTERHIAFSFATNALELPSLFMADGLQT